MPFDIFAVTFWVLSILVLVCKADKNMAVQGFSMRTELHQPINQPMKQSAIQAINQSINQSVPGAS